jgi:hypothetical protein
MGPAPLSEPRPQDVGVVAWTGNPQRYTLNYVIGGPNTGKLMLYEFMSGPGGVVSNLLYGIITAGTGVVNAHLGLYDMSGNLLGGSSADQSANMMAAGVYTVVLDTPVTLAPDTLYRVGMVIQAVSTSPTWPGFYNGAAILTNLAIPLGQSLTVMTGSGLTALPATYDPNALTAQGGGIVCVMT